MVFDNNPLKTNENIKDIAINTSDLAGPIGDNGSPSPSQSTQISGVDPSGNVKPVAVDADGNIITSGTSTVTGSVNVLGLTAFKTTIYDVDDLTIIQLFTVTFPNQSVVTVKAVCTGANYISIKEDNNPLTIGWPLYNGDTLQMDLTGAQNIYAIASAAGQILHGIQMGG